MENQPSQPNRPKSQIYLQRASQQTDPHAASRTPTITSLPAVRPALPVVRSNVTQRCPNCGAVQPASTSVCMACGAFIPSKAQKQIRCRRCGTRASANLVLCPGCGRELQAAPPRIGLFLAPVIIVAVFLVLLTRGSGVQLISWAQTQATTGWNWILTLGDRLDPQIVINTISPTPAAEVATNGGLFGLNSAPTTTAPAGNPATAARTTLGTTGLVTETVVSNNSFEPVIAANRPITNSTASAPPVAPTSEATAAATETPTVAPTSTPNPTATTPATPTQTQKRSTATATTQSILVAGTNVTETKGILLQPTPTIAPSATALPTVAPTATPPPTPTANVRTYTVRAGDTPFAIATQFDITVVELLSANGLGLEDARRLRVGQALVIPSADNEPTPTATAPASPTPTPVTPTATAAFPTWTPTAAAPTSTPTVAVRLDAPQLRSPEPDSFLSCQNENTLIWLPVAFMRENDQYRLHLGFLTGYNGDGTEQITWVLEQLMPAQASLWRMDEGLCGLAPQSTGRQWRWYVEVVETVGNELRPVSPASSVWGFSWN